MDSTYLPIARLDDAVRGRTRPRGGRRHRPRARAPRRRGARVRGPLPAPRRAAGRRPGRGRQPDLRRARLGLPARHRRLRLQPGRADLQVQPATSRTARCCVDKDELVDVPRRCGPSGAVASTYDRLFDDPHQDTAEEPFVSRDPRAGPQRARPGAHGTVAAMGVPRDRAAARGTTCRSLTAQLHRFPLLDDEPVDTVGDDRPGRREAAAPRHPGLRVRHELRRAVGGGEDRARAAAPRARAPRSAPARAACCPRSRPSAPATSTSWPRAGSAGTRMTSTGCRRCTSSSARAPRPAPAGTCPAPRSSGRIAEVRGPARGHAGGLARPVHRLDDAARRPRRSSTGSGSGPAASRSG